MEVSAQSHAYGSSAVVIVVLLHLTQTYLYGAYKGRRELLDFGMCPSRFDVGDGLYGYLLPWDQKAYFATTVERTCNRRATYRYVAETFHARGQRNGNPDRVAFFCRACVSELSGGANRVYRSTCLSIPESRGSRPAKRRPRSSASANRAVLSAPGGDGYDRGAVMILVLGLLSHFARTELGPKASPADTQYVPRPEWYYLPIFQRLKYWRGPLQLLELS